jgi:hypothetical protein
MNQEKQKIRNTVISELRKFLRVNNDTDVVISMLPERAWIVEEEILKILSEIQFKGSVFCLFYENDERRYLSQQSKYKSFREKIPKNFAVHYCNNDMPTPKDLFKLFKCPIFYWGDFCSCYPRQGIDDFFLDREINNSVVFLTFSLEKRLCALQSQSVRDEIKMFRNILDCKKPFGINPLCCFAYRSRSFGMVFMGFDNYDYSKGNAHVYNLRHNVTGEYKKKSTPKQILVYKKHSGITLKEIENIV